jgi:RimJ/RimL family protein N-acetyltransferase
MLTDESVMKFTGLRKALSRAKSRDLLKGWAENKLIWAAIENGTEKFVGWFMLRPIIENVYEIGFMLPKVQWNKGLASEVSLELLVYAKKNLRAKKVIAKVDLENRPSARVLEKIGMLESEVKENTDDLIQYEIIF